MLRKKGKSAAALLAAALLCMSALSGCTGESGTADLSAPGGSADIQSSAGSSSGEPDDTVTYSVQLTYANSKYIETGDESLSKIFRDGSADITVQRSADDGADLEYAVKETLRLLEENPASHGGGSDDATLVTDAFGIGGVTVVDGICTVDLTGEQLMEQNMYSEMFFIIQTADTLLNSFDDITGVSYTVNGEKDANLSYYSLSGTVTKDDIAEMTGEQPV